MKRFSRFHRLLLGPALGALTAGCVPELDVATEDEPEPVAAATFALAGDLDPGFGPGGFTVTDVDVSASGVGHAVRRQADGKLVVVGDAWTGTRYVGIVGRLNADGSRDLGFGGTGWVQLDLGASGLDLSLHGLVVQPDGKLIAVGRADNASGSQSYALVARFEADGRPDASFGDGGGKLLSAGSSSFSATAVALQADGRIIAAGARTPGTAGSDALVMRLTTSGALDPTFNLVGYRFVNMGTSEEATGVAVQPDGKIVIGGTSSGTHTGGTYDDMFAARLTTGGGLDTSFSGDGFALAVFNDKDTAHGLALQADGKIVLVGQTYAGSATSYDTAVARFLGNGALDPGFSGDGKVTLSATTGTDAAMSVVETSAGQVLVAGYAIQPGGRTDFMFARLTTGGAPDPSFDTDGIRLASFGTGAAARGVTLQPDGKAVAVGTRTDGVDSRIALMRANPSGALDANFDVDGRATLPFHSGQDKALASAMQADGKLVVVGQTHDGFKELCVVARYTTGGVLDTSFSGDGKLTFSFSPASSCSLDAAAIQADGRIVVGSGFAVARLTSAGVLDSSFSGDGRVELTIAEGTSGDGDLAIAADGKIWVGGSIRQLGVNRLGLARLSPDGSLDTSYSGDGWTTFTFSGADHTIHKIVPLADGRVVALGEAIDLGPLVTRFLASGAVEGNFGNGGKTLLGTGAFRDDPAALLVAPDGKTVAVTNAVGGIGVVRIVVSQLTTNGAFDPSFDTDGKRILQPLSLSGASAVVRQANGKLVVVGRGASVETQQSGCLFLRLNTGGALDKNYGGGDGWALHSPGYICSATDARLQPGSDTVVAAGFDTLVPLPPPSPIPGRGDTTPWDIVALRVQAQ